MCEFIIYNPGKNCLIYVPHVLRHLGDSAIKAIPSRAPIGAIIIA
jgi:hypothetical protein